MADDGQREAKQKDTQPQSSEQPDEPSQEIDARTPGHGGLFRRIGGKLSAFLKGGHSLLMAQLVPFMAERQRVYNNGGGGQHHQDDYDFGTHCFPSSWH